MAGHLHRDPFGNASAHEIPNGRASEVVRNATRRSSFLTCLPPGFREANDPFAFHLLSGPVKHPGTENSFGSEAVVLSVLNLEELL